MPADTLTRLTARHVHRVAARALLAGGTPGEAMAAAFREARAYRRYGPRLARTLRGAAVEVLTLARRWRWAERAG